MNTNMDIFLAVLLAVILILIATQIFGFVFEKIKQPRVVGEMVAGVVLGPTCLGYFLPAFSASVFPSTIMPYLFVLSNIGLGFYMFLVALEIDFGFVTKKIIRQSSVLSAFIIAIPFLLGLLLCIAYMPRFAGTAGVPAIHFGIFGGSALAITAFPMLARILQSKNLIKTSLGTISLFSASIQDMVSWILLAYVTAFAASGSLNGGTRTFLLALVYTGTMLFIVKPLLKNAMGKEKMHPFLEKNYMLVIIILLLVSIYITDKIGLYSVFGGFICGVAIPRNARVVENVLLRCKDFTILLLLPLFFAFSGLNANMLVLKNMNMLIPCLLLLLASFVGKYVVTLLVMRASGFTLRQSSAMGGLMNARGLMELIIANIGLMYGIINQALYSILVLIAVVSTLMAMPIYNFSLPAGGQLMPVANAANEGEEKCVESSVEKELIGMGS